MKITAQGISKVKRKGIKKYQTDYQIALKPESMVEIARQMEEASHLSKDLGQAEMNGITFKLMADQLTQTKRQLEGSITMPECAEL